MPPRRRAPPKNPRAPAAPFNVDSLVALVHDASDQGQNAPTGTSLSAAGVGGPSVGVSEASFDKATSGLQNCSVPVTYDAASPPIDLSSELRSADGTASLNGAAAAALSMKSGWVFIPTYSSNGTNGDTNRKVVSFTLRRCITSQQNAAAAVASAPVAATPVAAAPISDEPPVKKTKLEQPEPSPTCSAPTQNQPTPTANGAATSAGASQSQAAPVAATTTVAPTVEESDSDDDALFASVIEGKAAAPPAEAPVAAPRAAALTDAPAPAVPISAVAPAPLPAAAPAAALAAATSAAPTTSSAAAAASDDEDDDDMFHDVMGEM